MPDITGFIYLVTITEYLRTYLFTYLRTYLFTYLRTYLLTPWSPS